jgi:uridylate kinase
MTQYKRILLKLSGESLGGSSAGIDVDRLMDYAQRIKDVHLLGIQVGIVFGGGNIFRGLAGSKYFDRVKGDYMGMLATVINGLALESALESIGVKSRLFTAISMEPVGERFAASRAIRALESGEVAIFTFGTGNPYFTTDSASALRAIEIKADVLLKGTRVDGIYTADPEKDSTATKFEKLSFDEVIEKKLKVMDMTAFTMCQENNMPIVVFNMNEKEMLIRLLQGEKVGTIVGG